MTDTGKKVFLSEIWMKFIHYIMNVWAAFHASRIVLKTC
jgi:hypothetical protein